MNAVLPKDFVGPDPGKILMETAMRYVSWILKFALFVLVLTFAVRNTDEVTVRYVLGWEWQSPLIFVLLIAFCAGIALGLA
ncbi:MAG: LapA family protein, partial [Burkholderiales bacterium]